MNERNGPMMTNGSGQHGERESRSGKKKAGNGRKTSAKPKKQPKK